MPRNASYPPPSSIDQEFIDRLAAVYRTSDPAPNHDPATAQIIYDGRVYYTQCSCDECTHVRHAVESGATGSSIRYTATGLPYDLNCSCSTCRGRLASTRRRERRLAEQGHATAPTLPDTTSPQPTPAPVGERCQHCANQFPRESLRETNGGYRICADCIVVARYRFECQDCHRLHSSRGNLYRCENDHYLCSPCMSSGQWTWCPACDVLFPRGVGRDYCAQCAVNRRDFTHNGCDCTHCSPQYPGIIHNYSWRPYPFTFHGTDSHDCYLGLELEIETDYERNCFYACAQLACNQLRDLGYLKHDGSLSTGFEIVTHPMAYAWALDHFPWVMLTALADHGGLAAASAGLHIHVSRQGFSGAAHIYRWMQLIYRNHTQVTQIARRSSGEWAAFDRSYRRRVKGYAKGGKNAKRYSAINVQNDDTFEVRVFASTLDPQQLQAALGLVSASVEYTRTLTVADIVQRGGWSWEAFGNWVAQRPEYTALAAEMGLITSTDRDYSTANGEQLAAQIGGVTCAC